MMSENEKIPEWAEGLDLTNLSKNFAQYRSVLVLLQEQYKKQREQLIRVQNSQKGK